MGHLLGLSRTAVKLKKLVISSLVNFAFVHFALKHGGWKLPHGVCPSISGRV